MTRFCTRVVGNFMVEANEALDEIRAEMDRRYERLLAADRRKVEKGDVDKKQAGLFSAKLRDLVARARAAGIVVVAATQKPSTDLIPSALRDNFALKLAHRCSTREASDTILGSGWAAKEISSSNIEPRLRGVGYLLGEAGVPIRMRSMHLDDATIRRIVAQAKDLRGIS